MIPEHSKYRASSAEGQNVHFAIFRLVPIDTVLVALLGWFSIGAFEIIIIIVIKVF